jgi:hypothetical protein
VGVEQGDNTFRERTPALMNSAGEAAQVDENELYRRTVAMYTNGATYTAPPIVRSSFRTRPDWDAAQRPAAPPPKHEGPPLQAGPGIWSWLLPLGFFGALVVLIRRHRAFQLSEIG